MLSVEYTIYLYKLYNVIAISKSLRLIITYINISLLEGLFSLYFFRIKEITLYIDLISRLVYSLISIKSYLYI